MDRRLIFPAVAITAWAQQPAPAPPEVEAALRARVEQFFQLEVDKKFRQAEALVAEDSKDDFYNSAKPDIKSFSIEEIEWMDNNSRARVILKRKVGVKTPLGTQEFDLRAIALWKIENGQWVWYIDHDTPHPSPFGLVAPPPAGAGKGPAGAPPPPGKLDAVVLMNQVTIDNTSVVLNSSNPAQAVTVSNNMPGLVTLGLAEPLPGGIAVELEKLELKPGEKSAVRFRLTGEVKEPALVRVEVSPLGKVFQISVQSK
jgi:hypothetical protein